MWRWSSSRRERGTQRIFTQIDFMIGPRAFGQTFGKRVGHLPLWRDDIVCIASANNAAVPDRLTPAQFRSMRYAAYRSGPRVPPEVQTLLQPTSPLEIAPVCIVPNFLVLGAIVQQSDCIALVPRKVARTLAQEGRLRIVEISFPRKQLFIDAFWSPVVDSRRGRVWFPTDPGACCPAAFPNFERGGQQLPNLGRWTIS